MDSKLLGNGKKGFKIVNITESGVEELPARPAYFYVICTSNTQVALLERSFTDSVEAVQGAWIEELPDFSAVVDAGNRYVLLKPPKVRVFKVCSRNPRMIPTLAEDLRRRGFRVSASNVRYIVRNVFDHEIRYFDVMPLYWGFDSESSEKICRAKVLVFDVESIDGRPRLVSAYWWRPFEEIRKDDVMSFWLPEDEDELIKTFMQARIIAGHNILGYDIPVLERAQILINKEKTSLVDTSVVLNAYGSSLGAGSARSLLDVARVLKEKIGVTDEELELKREVMGRVSDLSKEELEKYNRNDIVLTAKVLNVIYPFIASVASLTQIPVSEVQTLPAGMVAEYFLLRFCEHLGIIPEYKPTGVELKGERVWLAAEGRTFKGPILHVDVKMMYPSYVLGHYIDPTLHVGNQRFDRRSGIGVLYSALERLRVVRQITKQLKKQDKKFAAIDSGVKAILNALAYGVQGKKSGLAIMGNPYCPSKIFYGTRGIQFGAIDYLKAKGYKPIYSDTDSLFILVEDKSVDEILAEVRAYFNKYGLDVDVEEIWDEMYIHAKKNYILRKGDFILIKGSALKNLDRYFLPECISLQELLTMPKEERLKYIEEAISSADIEYLFIRSAQQVWRLIGKDAQSFKRIEKTRQSRYLRVKTPWPELPSIVLKRGHLAQFLMPHSAPIVKLLIEHDANVDLGQLNPFTIEEVQLLKLDGPLMGLRHYTWGHDVLVYIDGIYGVKLKELYYGLSVEGQLVKVQVNQPGLKFKNMPRLERLLADLKVKKVSVKEEALRNCVKKYVIEVLRDYKLI